MNWGEFFSVSVTSLLSNKVRSFLTMLGIIIGVAAVITMISLGQGAKKAVADRIQALGTNLLFIRSGAPHGPGRVHIAIGEEERLDEKDLKKLNSDCPSLAYVVPELRTSKQIIYGNQNWNTSVIGTSPEYLEMRNYKLSDGQNFTSADVYAIRRVAVIGPTVAKNLFGTSSSIGKTIRIGRLHFEVLGITETKGASGGWMDNDDVIFIPYTTAQKRVFGNDDLGNFCAQLKDETMQDAAYMEIEKALRESHRLRPDQDNDFHIQSMSDFASARTQATETFTYLLASVAFVSLIVGGIGIMNTMLVTVTERTREIGVRIAVGARRKDILLQFVLESVNLSLLGGIIGILLGVGVSFVMTKVFGWTTSIAPEAVLVSFLFSFAIGLFFGIYPARKASLMDPIEALRYE